MEQAKKPDLVYQVIVPAHLAGKMAQKGMGDILEKCVVQFVGFRGDYLDYKSQEPAEQPQEVEEVNPQTPPPEEKAAPETTPGPKRMIKFRCPECGRLNPKMCTGQIYDIECFGCGKHFTFELQYLTKVQYNCEECGKLAWFWMPDIEGMSLNRDKCWDCGHETALAYNSETKQYGAF